MVVVGVVVVVVVVVVLFTTTHAQGRCGIDDSCAVDSTRLFGRR